DHRGSDLEAHHPQPGRRAGLRRRTQVPCQEAAPIAAEESIMLGVIAKLTIKPGTNAGVWAPMKALQAKVRADEPGNKLSALHKTGDANVYVMLERYDDQAALDAHR